MPELPISVIIPAYNCEDSIERAIGSVLSQTCQDFELIIVDDGSKDGTRDKIRSIHDSRIHLILHKKNRGAAAARNTGMRYARGKYVAWLDSDDEWLPDKLSIQLKLLEKTQENEKASYTAYFLIEKGRDRIYIPKNPSRKELFLGCDLSPGSTLVFERSLLNTVGYLDESLPRYEDWDWLIRYMENYSFSPANQALVRVFHEQTTRVSSIENASKMFLSKYHKNLKEYGWFFKNKVTSMFILEIAKYHFVDRKVFKGLFYLLKGILIYPFQSPSFYFSRIKGLLNLVSNQAAGVASQHLT